MPIAMLRGKYVVHVASRYQNFWHGLALLLDEGIDVR